MLLSCVRADLVLVHLKAHFLEIYFQETLKHTVVLIEINYAD